MKRLSFVPFADKHIPRAAQLLAGRHAAHRLLEPLLPQVPDFDWQVAGEFENATGVAALAIRETAASGGDTSPPDVRVRSSTPADLSDVARLAAVLEMELDASPSFGGMPVHSEQELAEEWSDIWTDDRYVHFVAERGGRVVGHTLLYRRPAGDLRVPENSIDLGNEATMLAVRGSGVGIAMTAYVLAWARQHGYATMTTDWRMSNLPASRFWPRRGFREAFLRLYRSLP